MTSPAAGAGGGNQSGRRRQRLPTIKSVEERAGEASLSASPAMSSRRSPARRHSRGSAAMSQPRASFEVARAQSATPMRQNHSNLIQDSVVEGASVRSNIQATLDSIQLWPAKVSSSGRYSLTGGGEGAEAACGIENQVAVEDLPLTRLPSQSRAALAGRRPLYPVAEGHAGSQGQGQPGSASPSPTRDGKRASLTGQALRPSRTTLPTLTAGQQPPQQPSTSAITSAQQPASSPIDAIRALRSAQLAGASSLSPDSPAARRPARRATSPAHSPPSHPVHWPASQGSSARHSPEAPGTAWPSDSRAASQRPSPDSPAGASPELHMRRQFAGLHLDPLTQSTEAEASSFLERLSGQAAAASLGPTKKANAPTTVVAQPVAVSAMEESACVSALLQDVYENGNGTLSALLHARKHSNNQDSTSLTAFGSVELVTTRMDSGMRLMDDSSVLLGDSALLSRPASPGQPIPDVTPPGTAALQVSGYDHRHYTEGQSPRCKASPLAGSSGRQPAFCEGMTASLQQSLDIRGAGPGAGRTPPAWSSCDSLAPATLSTSHRAFTPPVIVASKVHDSPPFHSTAGAQDHNATWPVVQHLRLSHGDDLAGAQDDELMELIFDPILNCYYDAKTNQYYTLK
ncbi:hypothetical protein WJX72_012207 [[Myrmecia] bisecta]|uniref:Uncharacterized protein n=1 Tax=[Myrmecia] bisecta TaxID=41462 RepID=A0AAW1P6I6_9CHLO